MSKNLSKTPEMLRREAEIVELRAALKQKQTTLKQLKTRLQNTRSEIEQVQHKFHTEVLRQMERLDDLRQQISDLAGRLLKVKWLDADEKAGLRAIATDFGSGSLFGEDFGEYREQKARMEAGEFDFEEEERARMRDLFQQFGVAPDKEEQRDIRKLFLKLSSKFHPDKANNDKEEADFHTLMQEINDAYQRNDMQALLEMERLYFVEELDFTRQSVTVDVLQKEIDRLQKELSFIENQIERTSGEIKNLRRSDLGRMLTDLNRADRMGMGMDATTDHQEQLIDLLTRLRDGMKESLALGRLSPMITDAVEEMMSDMLPEDDMEMSEETMLDFLLEMMEDEDAENFGFGDSFWDDEEEEVENPNFPIGSSVRVTQAVPSLWLRKVKMKDWEGRVEAAYYDEEGQVFYQVSFDSRTVNQMPDDLIRKAVRQGGDFQVVELAEYQLAAAEPRDTEDEAFIAYRRRMHGLLWENCPPEQAERLRTILLQEPLLSDEENWQLYLEEHLPFPFAAESREMLGSPAGISMKVMGFADDEDEYGPLVEVKVKGRRGKYSYPLVGLQGLAGEGETPRILDDYFTWAEEMMVV